MIAEEKPMLVNNSKNAMKTVAMATTPKSSGVSSRASTAITTKEMTMPEYFATAVYITPDIICCFNVLIAVHLF